MNDNPLISYSSSFDNSGYGVAARDMCSALIDSGLNIATKIIYTPMSRHEISKCDAYDKILSRNISTGKAKISICEQVPILWDIGFQKNSYRIGRIYWETDKLPDQWVDIINKGCDELWASCKWNRDVFIKSGVEKPIYIIPPIVNSKVSINGNDFFIPGDNLYKFYSIFQWTERKNPEALLRAYFNEFTKDENVLLVIKSYGPSVSLNEKRIIKEIILDIKHKSNNPDPPPVFFIGELLKPEQISAIHAQCNCYISTSRGEGWNVPGADSMCYGNQVITTKIGGITDLLDNDVAYIIPNTWRPVFGMPFGNIYNDSMNWGHIEISDIQKAMRQAFNERDNYFYRKNKYGDILEQCSKKNVIEKIKDRINDILPKIY